MNLRTSICCVLSAALALPAQEFQGKIGKTVAESTPAWPTRVQAPKGAPNVLWIVLDDVGFGHTSTFGGPVQTPSLERLAQSGLRYTNFHTTALCSPTRAALLSGRNHHSVAFGMVSEFSGGYPGYNGMMPLEKALISEILLMHGYSTFAVGKWHLAPAAEMSKAGPFDRWPLGRGFEHYFGFLGGETDQYHPNLVEDNTTLDGNLHGKHLTEAITDRAIDYLQDHLSVRPEKPFFLYWASGATHAPLQAPAEWRDKYKGKFDQGWDKVREETLARQKQLGIVPADVLLPPREDGIKSWDSLSPLEKKVFARMNEVFAAMGSHTDFEIGRMVHFLEQKGVLDNTLIIVNVGDNGASQEGGFDGMYNDTIFFNAPIARPTPEENMKWFDKLGTEFSSTHYPMGWAMAGNTPFRRYKQDASNEGATRNPLILSWPARIKDKGAIRTQFHHATDLAPTLLEAIGIKPPEAVKGYKQAPFEGVSMVYTFDDAKAKTRHPTQYFEMLGRRAIVKDGWKALTYHAPGTSYDSDKWELYNLSQNFNETDDLAAKYPSMVKEMQSAFEVEAKKYNVYPLDDRIQRRALPTLTRPVYEYFPSDVTMPRMGVPTLVNRSYSITAEIEVTPPTTSEAINAHDGSIFAMGGFTGGFALYVKNGGLTYAYNLFARDRMVLRAPGALSPGKHAIKVDMAYDGGGPAKGATVTLFVDGRPASKGRLEQTVPVTFNTSEGLDVGSDRGTPVSEEYASPFVYQGKVHKIVIDLHP
ncbi:MAG: arylsulfatase [Bryobacteraceae bacterium]